MAYKKIKKIKVIYRKLGRENAFGLSLEDESLIEIDSELNPRKTLFVTVHEAAHLALPELSESKILRLEKIIGKVLWQEDYRKVIQ